MHPTVYRVLTVLCALVAGVPLGTNLGLVLVLWMLLTGRLLTTRGAVIPGLSALGLSPTVVRRSWAALGQGAWTADQMLANWQGWGVREGAGQPHVVAQNTTVIATYRATPGNPVGDYTVRATSTRNESVQGKFTVLGPGGTTATSGPAGATGAGAGATTTTTTGSQRFTTTTRR